MEAEMVISETKQERRQFTWLIRNFADIKLSKEIINEHEFQFEMGDSIDLASRWKAFLKVSRFGGENWMGVGLSLVKAPAPSCTKILCTFGVQVRNSTGGFYCDMRPESAENMAEMAQGWRHKHVIPLHEVPHQLVLTEDGSLPVILTVTLFKPDTSVPAAILQEEEHLQPPPAPAKNFEAEFLEKISQDLKSILEDSSISGEPDTRVVSRDGKAFVVSRAVLCVWSPVFQKMFQAEGMEEATTGVVHISDISSPACQIILNFLHTGRLDKEWMLEGIVEEVVYAAHKYLLKDLVQYFDCKVGQVCTINNCGRLLSLAKKLELKKAENMLQEWIIENVKEKASLEDVVRVLKDAKVMWTPTLGRPARDRDGGDQPE